MQVPEPTPGEKQHAFTVNCEWGSLASWLETLLPEDEAPRTNGSTLGSSASWNATSSSAARKGEPRGEAGWQVVGFGGVVCCEDRHASTQS